MIRDAFAGRSYASGMEPAIAAALRTAGAAAVALVAEADGRVVGQVMASPVAIDGRASDWHALGPVAVRPDAQRTGVGSRLVRATLDRLRALGSAGCVVVGDPGYYERFGFGPSRTLVAPDEPAAFFQVLPFGSSAPTGAVTFHPAFHTV